MTMWQRLDAQSRAILRSKEVLTVILLERVPEDRILEKLQRRYNLTEEKAKEYYDRFAVEA